MVSVGEIGEAGSPMVTVADTGMVGVVMVVEEVARAMAAMAEIGPTVAAVAAAERELPQIDQVTGFAVDVAQTYSPRRVRALSARRQNQADAAAATTAVATAVAVEAMELVAEAAEAMVAVAEDMVAVGKVVVEVEATAAKGTGCAQAVAPTYSPRKTRALSVRRLVMVERPLRRPKVAPSTTRTRKCVSAAGGGPVATKTLVTLRRCGTDAHH